MIQFGAGLDLGFGEEVFEIGLVWGSYGLILIGITVGVVLFFFFFVNMFLWWVLNFIAKISFEPIV